MIGEKIAAVPDAGGVVGAGRGDAGKAGGGDAAIDHDAARAGAFDEIEAGRELRQQGRIEIEAGARKAGASSVEDLGREDMRFLQAGDLHAQRAVGREQRIGQRDQAVAVVDGVRRRKRVAVAERIVQP